MTYIFSVFAGAIGLIFGSFLSVIVSRLDEKDGIFLGRSECPKCLAKLKWYDLLPILSFVFLGGKCRYCKDKISFVYPVMEITMALSFFFYFWINGINLSWTSLYWPFMIFIFLALLFFDYKFYILPDKIIFIGLIVTISYKILFWMPDMTRSVLTGLGLAAFFGIIYLVSKGEWMGFGDVKLVLLIGLVLGFPSAVFSIILSVWIGAAWGLALMAINRANLKTALPFGSFMSGMTVIIIIFNNYANFTSYYI